MELTLEAIKSLPGVACVFYYDPQKGILARESEPKFIEADLASVGLTLEKIFSWGSDVFSDIEQINLQYDESSVLVLRAAPHRYLIVIHGQDLDRKLLSAALIKTLKDSGKNPNPASGRQAASESAPGGETAAKDTGTAAAPSSGGLSILETSLNKVMGPMAAMVFQDACQDWRNGVDHSVEKLVHMLCAEIGDPEKIKVFKNLIAPQVKSQ